MLRDKSRLVALDKSVKTGEVNRIERLGTADRHAYAVQRNRMIVADALKRLMRRSAGAHVVLGVHLEETRQRAFCEDRIQVFVLEAGPGQVRNGQDREAETAVRTYVPYARDGVHRRLRSPPTLVLNRGQRAVLATRNGDARASAAANELPSIALEINGRGALTRRARPRSAIVLRFEGDAVALFLSSGCRRVCFRFRQRRGSRHGRNRGRHSTGQKGRAHNSSHGHELSPIDLDVVSGVDTAPIRIARDRCYSATIREKHFFHWRHAPPPRHRAYSKPGTAWKDTGILDNTCFWNLSRLEGVPLRCAIRVVGHEPGPL